MCPCKAVRIYLRLRHIDPSQFGVFSLVCFIASRTKIESELSQCQSLTPNRTSHTIMVNVSDEHTNYLL